jgi:hypothetical protein
MEEASKGKKAKLPLSKHIGKWIRSKKRT